MKWLVLLVCCCLWITDFGEAWSSFTQRRRMILDLLLSSSSMMIPSYIASAKEMDENENIQTMCQNGAILPGKYVRNYLCK